MAETATVKLTAKQQQVVNLMADGYRLSSNKGCGRHASNYCSLRNGSKSHSVPSNMHSQLYDKGIVESDPKASDWRGTTYILTDLGRSLATKIEPQKLQRWYYTNKHYTDIDSEEFASSTPSNLFMEDGRKVAKSSEWRDYFPTREAAVKYVHNRLKRAVESAERNFKDSRQALAEFEKRESL